MSAIAPQLFHAHNRISVIPDIYAEVVSLDSPSYHEALRLQAARFGTTVNVGSGPGEAYMAVTDYAPQYTIPIIVRRSIDAPNHGGLLTPGALLGTARLELTGATLIEATMRLRPGSIPAQALSDGRATEIGGFATPPELDRATLLDVVDTLVAAILRIADQSGIDWFWLFPRVGFMGLMWASIPGILPPYRFTLSPDVLGWNDGNERLAQLRALRPRGLQDFPELYHISREMFQDDLERRLALRPLRDRLRPQMDTLLFGAMRQASRLLPQHAPTIHAQTGPTWSEQALSTPQAETMPAARDRSHRIWISDDESGARQNLASRTGTHSDHKTPVAFTGSSSETDAEYLQTVMQTGGASAFAYKETSFRFLDLQLGMRVLDVGCGRGLDFPALAARVGPTGRVIGLERDSELVAIARQSIDSDGLGTCAVFQGDGEQLTFPAAMFDRVRADRALQHFAQPEKGLREMWRVLCPDGILSVVEPDWKAIVLWPSSGAPDPNDDTALQHVLSWHQRQLPHGLIGRQLSGLLRAMGSTAWAHVEIEVHSFELNWTAANAILQLKEVSNILAQEQPALRQELDNWLERMRQAGTDHTFFATIPLFFATARKAVEGHIEVANDREPQSA